MNTATELRDAIEIWPRVGRILSPVETPRDYDRATELLDQLIDYTGADERHPLASLVELLGLVIEDYERSHLPEPAGDPIAALQYLMTEHGLTASDLSDIDTEPHVQAILNRERQLTVEQVAALSTRFHVSPAVFIEYDH